MHKPLAISTTLGVALILSGHVAFAAEGASSNYFPLLERGVRVSRRDVRLLRAAAWTAGQATDYGPVRVRSHVRL